MMKATVAKLSHAVGMRGKRGGFDGFAGEGVGHEQRLAIGDAHTVAALADVIDHESFSHGARR